MFQPRKMNALPFQLVLFACILQVSVQTLAADAPPKIGPHGGQIVEDQKTRVEVRLIPKRKLIDAYLLQKDQESKSDPKNLAITLYDQSNKPTTIELRPTETSDYPRYQANLSPWQGSWIGFEVRIPISGGERKLAGKINPDQLPP